jgi:ubiquinone/menaquinone biosynthesis C-methylase UbiE
MATAAAAAVRALPHFSVLNYGFSSEPENTVLSGAEPDFYCLRLYEHTLRHTPLEAATVLEVSCGQGGGASFLARAYRPTRVIGIDSSDQNIRIARERASLPDLEFRVGVGERLELADESFDVVVNIEASYLCDDRARFFAEVFRVLRPGGYFCYTDACWADDDCTQELRDIGFDVLERAEITWNVLRALRRDSARREALFNALPDERLRDELKDWGGVVGYRAFRRFEAGQTRYFSHRLRRPSAAATG